MNEVRKFLWRLNSERYFYLKNIRKLFDFINTDIKISNYYDCKEVLFDNIYFKYKEFLPKGDGIVFDIGSQYGDYAIACNKLYGSKPVIAFEPLKRNYKIAKRNIKLSKAGNSVFLDNSAISNEQIIGIDNKNMFSNLNDNGELFKPDFIVLDNFIIELEKQFYFKIDIIKIDVEGFEMNVLDSAINTIKKYKPKLIIETHSFDLYKKVSYLLADLGYNLVHKDYNGSTNTFDYIVNNFFLPS